MTLDDLLKIMERVSSDFYSLPADLPVRHLYQAQVVAIVRALRDEMQFGDWTAWHRLNEILGDAGNEKVAGACADGTVVQRQRYGENDRQSKDGAEVSPRHPDPATDPCPHCNGEGCTPHLDRKGNVYPEPCQHCETTGRVPATDPAPNSLRDAIARARGRPLDPERDIPMLNKIAAVLKAPAPAVCEWTPQDEGPAHEIWKTGCGTMYERAKSTGWCGKCKAPIKFTEAK